MELQDQIDIGRQAEEFLRYLSDHPYFDGLLERVKLEYAQRILTLTPIQENVEKAFLVTLASMRAMDNVMNAVRGDIYLASESLRQIDGVTEKGIL